MKVYILNPPFLPRYGRGARWQDVGRGGTLYYPIWLAYVTGVIEQDHETKLVDAPAWNWSQSDVLEDIKEFQPDLVVIDTSFPSLDSDIELARAIKQVLETITVLVGPVISQLTEQTLNREGVDIVAGYEYDLTLKELASAIKQGNDFQKIRGISYKHNSRLIHNPDRPFTDSEDLDKIPFVSQVYKRHLHIHEYFLGQCLYPEIQIFTGRGCPFQCTFCSWPETLMGRKYRVRSVPNVLDELEWISSNLPEIKEVFFEDDTFTIDKKRVIEFCRQYRNRGLKTTWSCNARADLDFQTMLEMKKANCRLIVVGYESGDDQILKNIRKGITTEQIRQFALAARKADLLVHGDFIIGLPGETKETIEKTKRLIHETRPDILQVSIATPFPGTEFYRWAQDKQYLTLTNVTEYLDEQGHQKSIVSYPWLSSDEVTRAVDDILRQYYLSVRYVPIALRQVFARNGLSELRRLWRSARNFLTYIRR